VEVSGKFPADEQDFIKDSRLAKEGSPTKPKLTRKFTKDEMIQ
jgi:hypothetical protein